ncbi:hypothetical protein K450DRAFT_176406 [Umbelopsis ramanniana AG]|uniref:HypA-like protein n=1 Tax=Umbelopsis ramanniana AG TaxID=1314678 RepID=A0AAD5E6F8_UMBRA|nr:uncharacterized protein K450DRAFT_176406 [Umbelopsis ramanniana AG]KAI8578368.1 hypothetical protein K450DRAFT_176406 [Umbelopsis ramanniana AG]
MTIENASLFSTKHAYSFSLPGITLESRKVLEELLLDNHKKYHIFFNVKQFHNHNPHILLAAAALGASPEALRKIYDIHITYQKPLIAPKYEITDQNFTDYLFEDEAYSSYLAFFDKKLETMSIEEVFTSYAIKEAVLDNLFAGLFHPLIHFCYGLEFSQKLVAAEGLAMACVHGQDKGFRVQELNDMEYMHLQGKSINDILEDIRNDPVLKRSRKYDPTTDGFGNISSPEESKSLLKHIAQWQIYVSFPPSQAFSNLILADAEDIDAKIKELYIASVDIYAASQRPGKKPLLDFYLIHLLTSVYFVQILLPSLHVKDQAKLLRAYFAKFAQWYAARGSPKFDRAVIYNYQSTSPAKENPWFEVWDMGIKNMDFHVVKVVRALSMADEMFSPEGDHYYLKAAQMTVECTVHGDPLIHNAWTRKPPGYDEAWE